MPVTPTYPGVYIEEISSGVRTITGVATSITAFVGRALRGPIDKPITINSFGDFQRIFGGLWVESQLGLQVQNFFLNGGSQAIIVRVFHDATADGDTPGADSGETPSSGETPIDAGGGAVADGDSEMPVTPAADGKATIARDSLIFSAAAPGKWGNYLRVRIDNNVVESVVQRFGLDSTSDLFNLTVRDTKTGVTEQFRNVSVKESPRRIDRVLENESSLIRLTTTLSDTATVPTPHQDEPTPTDPPETPPKTIWEDGDTSSKSNDDGADGAAMEAGDIAPDGKW